MRARVIEVVEVEVGSVRRYFTRDGEPLAIVDTASADEPAVSVETPQEPLPRGRDPQDPEPVRLRDLVDLVPRRRIVPPFDPTAIPCMRAEATEEPGEEPGEEPAP